MKQTKTCISTKDGEFFDFYNPKGYDFQIETIAHALSNICRYGGHSDFFYSVAEHSVLVSKIVPADLALCGLLHDASEAFVGDMPSPLKKLCPDYRKIEESVQAEVARKFGLPYPFPEEIHRADKEVYLAERLRVTPSAPKDKLWHTHLKPASVDIKMYWPWAAKAKFLERYYELIQVDEMAA